MSMGLKYNDLDVLFLHIDNRAKYLKHKQKLQGIKSNISRMSLDTLHKDNYLKHKHYNQSLNKEKEEIVTNRDNLNLKNKIKTIQNRENVS